MPTEDKKDYYSDTKDGGLQDHSLKRVPSTQEIILTDDKTVAELGSRLYKESKGVNPADLEFILDKVHSLSINEAKQILKQIIIDHGHDVNFESGSLDRMKKLIEGPEELGLSDEDYAFELKSEAAVCKFFSPYPEVRAVTDPIDDPSIPVETIRAHFLGYFWAAIGQFINTFFLSRWPNITISSSVCQILLYPCGKLLELVLPDWGITVFGTRHSLNPGPWTYKEQMFSTIIFNIALTSVYAFYNIQTQQIYYNDTWLDAAYQILLILSTQLMGFGFAGILRRFVVYPIQTYWPTLLPTLALNRALLVPEKKETIHGWKISRYNFFFICFAGMFIYYWFPAYLFQGLSYFSWLTWIAPDNFNLAAVTGSQYGLGFNPWPTFDWNMINYFNPLAMPFWSFSQQFIGTVVGGLAILILFYTNNNNSAYLPINSSALFDNTGARYKVSRVIKNGILDQELYEAYSPPFYSSANLVVYGAFFAAYPLSFLYIVLDQWRLIGKAYRALGSVLWGYVSKSFRHGKSATICLFKGNIKGACSELQLIFQDDVSVYEGFDDPFTNMVKKYPEVPDWWFLSILVIAFLFSIILLTEYPQLNTPKWTIFFVIAINVVFLVPMVIMESTTGTSIGLNVLVELIIGYALPGNGEALMFVKAFGYNIDGQSSNYISDQKLAHYCAINPRSVFRGQTLGTIISAFVAYGVIDFVDNHIEGICTSDQKQHFTCAATSQVYFSASVVWGVIGPERIFGQQYPILKWMFLFGFLLSLAWWSLKKFGGKFKKWFKGVAPDGVYNAFDKIMFTPLGYLYHTHPALLSIGFLQWAPLNLTYQTTGLYFSFFFMYYLRKFKTAWWEKYNYVLASGFSAGMAFSAIILFFAVQYHPKDISWWGNNIIYEGVDGGASERTSLYTELPAKGYFGADEWH